MDSKKKNKKRALKQSETQLILKQYMLNNILVFDFGYSSVLLKITSVSVVSLRSVSGFLKHP